jgi:hypothetical protein
MLAEATRTLGTVATNDGGDNMDAGVISALLAGRDADRIVLEVDELHVPNIAEKLDASVLVLLNLSRDQLDRVGEINKIERVLRECVEKRPGHDCHRELRRRSGHLGGVGLPECCVGVRGGRIHRRLNVLPADRWCGGPHRPPKTAPLTGSP